MTTPDLVSQVHRYSVDEYDELVALGAFEDQRVELIDGLILDMSPKSPEHENAVEWLIDWLTQRIDRDRYRVRVAASVRLETSEPEPDLAVVDRDRRRDRHPERAHLVIEVALTSRERDLTVKPRLYAPVVPEYWVLDIEGRELIVHRDPGPDGYREVTAHGRGSTLRPEHLSLGTLRISELLAAI